MRFLGIHLILLLSWCGLCHAAPGDVSFRVDDAFWRLNGVAESATLDLFIDIDSANDVPAIAWGAVLTISPQPGAVGTVEFSPPAIVGNTPNLSPASTSAFIDFDRDTSGTSYGELGASASELNAFAAYVTPQLGPPPTLDSNGNLMLSDGAGLVSIPITASADAAGDFLIDFEDDPAVTGVVFATGQPEPNDIALHPVGIHTAGLLTIVNPPGDYDHDGLVTGLDFLLWQRGGSPDPLSPGDLAEWEANFGAAAPPMAASTAVPEPTTLIFVLVLVCMAMGGLSRLWCPVRPTDAAPTFTPRGPTPPRGPT